MYSRLVNKACSTKAIYSVLHGLPLRFRQDVDSLVVTRKGPVEEKFLLFTLSGLPVVPYYMALVRCNDKAYVAMFRLYAR